MSVYYNENDPKAARWLSGSLTCYKADDIARLWAQQSKEAA